MSAFDDYVDQYGMHFNKRLYEWAVGMMRDRTGGRIPIMEKTQFDSWLKERGVIIKNNKGYDGLMSLLWQRPIISVLQ